MLVCWECGLRVCYVVAELLKGRLVLEVYRIVKDACCGDLLDIALLLIHGRSRVWFGVRWGDLVVGGWGAPNARQHAICRLGLVDWELYMRSG